MNKSLSFVKDKIDKLIIHIWINIIVMFLVDSL